MFSLAVFRLSQAFRTTVLLIFALKNFFWMSRGFFCLTFTALRFFTVYGPRMRPDMMAYKLLDNIFRGRAVPLYNKGQMHRDWTYVSDIVQGVVAAIDRPMGYEQINLGRGSTTLLADFVARIEQLAGARSNLDDQPMPAADMLQTYADVSKAERLLGYRPTVDVADGTERFYRWYRAAVVTP